MKKILVGVVALLSALTAQSAFGQGSFVPAQTALKSVNGVMTPIGSATITVCPSNAAGLPCTPANVNIYSDAALTQPKTNPFTSDAFGNYQFAVASGTYTITVTASGFAGYSYQVSTPSGGSSSATWASLPGGTNNTSSFNCGTGCAIGPLGSGTITATAVPFSGVTGGSNTSGSFNCGTGCSFTFSGSGMISASVASSFNTSTVAGLPAAPATGTIYVVNDAASTGSCTAGGGAQLSLCRYNGVAWVSIGGGTAAFSGLTSSTNTTAAMVVGTGASLGTSGTGSLQATGLPSSTVASLPVNLPVNTLYEVTDAAQFGNCTTGGGTQRALCRWNGASWESIGGSTATSAYYALANGLLCDGATDDTAALVAVDAAMKTAGGGTLIYPHGKTCKFSSAEFTMANNADTWTDGAGTISSQAPIHWTCDSQDVQFQQLMSAGATLSQIQNACVLDFEFNAADAKFVSLGMGHFEMDHLAMVDKNTDCAPFMLFTNTIPDIHDNAFIGSTLTQTGGPYSCNDAIILGAAGGTQPGKTVSNWFQGYAGAQISHNFFNQTKRAVLMNNAAQTIMVFNNTVWSQGGCAACGAFELAGASLYSNTFSYNNIETVHYPYGVNITNNATNTLVVGQTCSDAAEFATLCVRSTGTDIATFVLGGFAPAANMISTSDKNISGIVYSGATSKLNFQFNGFVNLWEQSGAPGGTAGTEALWTDKTSFRLKLTKWHQATVYNMMAQEDAPNTQTSTASDTFVRANAATLGANWTALSGLTSLQILSNVAATQATGAYEGDYYSNITFGADQWSLCTLGAVVSNGANYVMCAVRIQSGAASFYAIQMTTDGATFCKIRKFTAATPTDLAACASPGWGGGITVASGDTLLLTVVGNTISAYHNGIPLVSTTDSTYTSGSPGIVGFVNSAAADIKYSAWSGGYMNCQPGVVTGLNIGTAAATCTPSPAVAGLNMSTSTNSGTPLLSATAPTISTHFNTSGDSILANGTASFSITVGTGTAGSTGALTLPTALTGWTCWLTNQSRADQIQQTGSTTTSATFTNFGTTFAATNWTNSDVLRGGCTSY